MGDLILSNVPSQSDDSATSLPDDDNSLPIHPDLSPNNRDPDDLLMGKHECDRDCRESWVQDLSRFHHMVKLGEVPPGTKPTIHQPAYHHQGPQDKWYCVYAGKAVGIFNSW